MVSLHGKDDEQSIRKTQKLLTSFDGEVAEGEGHRVPREDVVAAVHLLPID